MPPRFLPSEHQRHSYPLLTLMAVLLLLTYDLFTAGGSPVLVAAHRSPPKSSKAVLLSDVKTLTLRGHGAKTSHRRVSAIPQLRCISSRAICALYDIDVMRCENAGSSYSADNVEWSCKATLPSELKLGSTDVLCEGYSGSDDPYVLKGSCGVEYRLALTADGERRYPKLARGGGRGGRKPWSSTSPSREETDWSAWLFGVIFVAVLVWILYSACCAATRGPRGSAPGGRRRPRGGDGRGYGGGGGGGGPGGGGGGRGGRGGGGWGGGWNTGLDLDDSDPPPPYPGTGTGTGTGTRTKSSTSSPSQQQGWSPGFWSGLTGGAAAGYAAGAWARNRDSRPGESYSSWRGEQRAGEPSSSSSSSARHESTGFGSTNRR